MSEGALEDNNARDRQAPARQRLGQRKARRLKRRHDGVAPVWRANVVYRTFRTVEVTMRLL